MCKSNILNFCFGKIIIILFPVVVAFPFLRIVSSKSVMEWEYKKSNFPEDKFGFTIQQRIKYGKMFLDYWYKNLDISYLGELTFENTNTKMLNKRELIHMVDVKNVIHFIFKIFYFTLVLFLVSFIFFSITNKNLLLKNIFYGGIFNLSLILFIAIFGLFFFDTAFDLMHKFLGFKGDSYTFYESDTLIRLFPLKFWFDMFTIMAVGILSSTIIVLFASWKLMNYNNIHK